MKIFTASERDAVFTGKSEHYYYKEAVKRANDLRVHADGLYPECLIEERRPNEPMEVKDYRKKIWVAKTKPTFTKVYNSLQKIRRSADWSIKYPKEGEFPKIIEGEELETYMEKKFPFFGSFTNWTFNIMMRDYLIDANGVVLIMPINPDKEETDYEKPFPFIFQACDVLDFVPDTYAVLKNPTGSKYKIEGRDYEGKSFYFVNTQTITRWDQVSVKDFAVTLEIFHELDMLPVVKWKGVMIANHGVNMLYESRLQGMVPEMDEAVREYSDLQAAKVLHIYPERWEYSQNECRVCKGLGQRRNPHFIEGGNVPCDIDCNACEGRGYIVAGPYNKIIVRPTQGLEGVSNTIPTPPAGYVEKDTEIVKVQEESIERHLYNALAAVNFEFLSQSPLAQSGVSKAQDRDEAGNTSNSIAEDIVAFMDECYKIFSYYRYKLLYGREDTDKMCPVIAVPEKFDLVTASDIGEQLKSAKDSKINPRLITAIEIEYANKKFAQEPEIRDMVSLTIELDPLAGVSEDDKMSRLSNKGITQLTYVISSNIQEFVQNALDEDPDFPEKELSEQKKVIEGMAQEIINEQEQKRIEVTNGVQQDNEEDIEFDQEIPADNASGASGGNGRNTNATAFA